MTDTALDALAAHAGIFDRYRDLAAVEHVASPDTKRALLDAMGLDVAHPGETLAWLRAETAARSLPSAVVVKAGEPAELRVQGADVEWRLAPDPRTAERLMGGRSEDGVIALPPLAVGLHVVIAREQQTLVVTAPEAAPDLAMRGLAAPRWGVTTALYGLRSNENLGIGTYRDLAVAGEALGRQGVDFLGINPVHALGVASGTISPYSPTHRGFLNTTHIAPDYDAENGTALRAAAQVDYAAGRQALDGLLRRAHARMDRVAAEDFRAFRNRSGSALQDFATFEALSLVHGADWRRWPETLKHPTASAVLRFAAENEQEVEYHAYLQWLADSQLASAQRRAKGAGMALGLYVDLAIGVRPDGAEVWGEPNSFARGVSLGTPPDQFNAKGQVWGLAPMSPLGLQNDLFRPFVDTLRAVVGHAGLARIDHVLGFMRCFWVPEDGTPGAYVRYPTDLLLALTKVEAFHAGCIIIGEDLGVLPEGLRDRLAESQLYGCSVAQFERDPDGDLTRPSEYRARTLASFSTHDTPTVRGFWQGWEIERQQTFGQLDDDTAAQARQRRDWDRRRLHWLVDGASDEPPQDIDAVQIARIHAALADGASDLIAVQLDDVFARIEQPNFPGTVDEYPNWRLKCPVAVGDLEEISALEPVRRSVENRRSRDR
ncbi:4-alpha-glucanotransferase [Thalassobaculum sp.]|uniref:4-alpha-glucanotransferase n=1 Tax=Thalassobaculum sp. TaxID=2022740 RepID=UPI003B592C83